MHGQPHIRCRASYRNTETVKRCILLVVLCEVRVYVRQTLGDILRDGCICCSVGCIVVYSVSEYDFVRRMVVYVCLRVINTNCAQYQLLSTEQ